MINTKSAYQNDDKGDEYFHCWITTKKGWVSYFRFYFGDLNCSFLE